MSAVRQGRVPSVLLVDDTPANLVALDAVISPLSVRTLKASSGEGALSILLKEEPAVIILDVMMPGLDGFETARLIRGTDRICHIPILFITAVGREEAQILKGYAAGAVDYLLKPFDPSILRSKVSAFLDLHAQRQRILERQGAYEQAAADAEAKYRLALMATLDVIWDWDVRKGMVEWSEAIHPAHGHSPSDIPTDFVGAMAWWLDHVHPEDRARVQESFDRAISSGELAWSSEYRFRRADQTYASILDRGYISRDPEGTPERMVGSMMDVTDSKRVEQDLRQASEFQEQLIGIVGHDLRTPLQALRVTTQRLASRNELDEESRRLVSRLGQGERRIGQIADLLVDFTRLRLGNGTLPVRLSRANLTEAVRAVIEELRLVYPGKRVELEGGETLVLFDAARMGQAISNLIENAIKYGEVEKPVTVHVAPSGRGATVEVHNSGKTIAPEVIPRLFKPFHRGPTKTQTGLGLGLYIVSEIVRAHGGEVDVQSKDGETAFRIRLPGPALAAAVAREDPVLHAPNVA